MQPTNWHQLIRKAYGVPDIVSDDAAKLHIGIELARAVDPNVEPSHVGPIPAPLLAVIEQLGDAGRLDGYLVNVGYFNTEQVAVDIAVRVDADNLGVVKAMLNDVVTRVRDYFEISGEPWVAD